MHHRRQKLFSNRAAGLIGEILFVLSDSGMMIGEILFVLSNSGIAFREHLSR